MTEEQADKIIELLEDINKKLDTSDPTPNLSGQPTPRLSVADLLAKIWKNPYSSV